MDSNDIERERGITILSKNTAVYYKGRKSTSSLVKATGGEGSEGIESKSVLTVNEGTVAVLCYDDCMNASNSIVLNGGNIYCYSSGNDGIDSNGTLTITGE